MASKAISRAFWAALALFIVAPAAAHAQSPFMDMDALRGVGWHGFLDFHYIAESFASLILAVVLGAIIAFHPMTPRTVDTLEEAELPKVYIMYALIGAIVGVTVLAYGMVVGLVVFGLGGLMRFRSTTASTRDTGRLITVTLIGLISGLNLPHFAVMAAAFAFVLIYIFDSNPICRVIVDGLPSKRAQEAADLYRAVLTGLGCKIIHERKKLSKKAVEFVLRMPHKKTRDEMETELAKQIPLELRGEVDWEIE